MPDAQLDLQEAAEVPGWEEVLRRIRGARTASLEKIQSRWFDTIDKVDHARLCADEKEYYHRVRLRAVENEVGGRWLTDDRGAADVQEEVWRFGARLRLGLPVLPWLHD